MKKIFLFLVLAGASSCTTRYVMTIPSGPSSQYGYGQGYVYPQNVGSRYVPQQKQQRRISVSFYGGYNTGHPSYPYPYPQRPPMRIY